MDLTSELILTVVLGLFFCFGIVGFVRDWLNTRNIKK